MNRAAILIFCLFLGVVLLTSCGAKPLTIEEKEEHLQQAIEEAQVANVDEELTAALMAEEKVKYAYVADQEDLITVYIAFIAETDSSTINDLSKKAKKMAEEKYPGRTITVDGAVDVK
jgi:hypothetical protein